MKKVYLVIILILLFTSGSVYLHDFQNKKIVEQPIPNEVKIRPLIIILSPHFDDGVLSLGGFMAKSKHQLLVATFFTKKPIEILHTNWDRISGFSDSDEAIFTRKKENENSLIYFNAIIKNYDYLDSQYRKKNEDKEIREKISKDIEALIKTYENQKIFIYGPATFGLNITHPDHQIVHDAFMDVWKTNKEQKVHFLIYEDFPYISQFIMSSPDNLKAHLEKTENIKLEENPIELDESELLEKITSIYEHKSQIKAFISLNNDVGILAKKFYKERCKTLLPMIYACEVVYNTTP